MPRDKLKYAPISDELSRKISLNKRTESLFKKANEIATLCDIEAAVIVQDPADDNETAWPSQDAAEEKVARFLALSDFEKSKKMTTLESYLIQSVNNKQEKQERCAKKIDEMEMASLMKEFVDGKIAINDFDMGQTNRLVKFLGDIKEVLGKNNQELANREQQQQQQQQHQSSSEIASHSLHSSQHQQLSTSHGHESSDHQHQQQQQSALPTASQSYNVTPDPQGVEGFRNDDSSLMETAYEKQQMEEDFYWESNVRSSQNLDFFGGDNDWDFYQANVGNNDAGPSSQNENVNSSDTNKKE